MKKLYNLIGFLALVFILTGCSSQNMSNTTKNTTKNTSVSNSNTTKKQTSLEDVNFEEAAKKQMSMPEEGETVAIIHVKKFGDIKLKFFEDVAPKAVENFLTHSKDGYYNGVIFHRVMEEFMIQGGDPTGTGTGGESIWGKGFGEEISLEIVPYRGSLCMASTGYGTNGIGSQFFITQANYSEKMESMLKQGGYPERLLKQYKEYGGYLSLYTQYTVFGQVYEGMDVVDKIASVEKSMSATGELSVPVEDVVIESVEVTTYKAK